MLQRLFLFRLSRPDRDLFLVDKEVEGSAIAMELVMGDDASVCNVSGPCVLETLHGRMAVLQILQEDPAAIVRSYAYGFLLG